MKKIVIFRYDTNMRYLILILTIIVLNGPLTAGSFMGQILIDENSGELAPFLASVGNLCVFVNKTVPYGNELWVSNGSPSGTHLLRDISPGPLDGITVMSVEFDKFFDRLSFADSSLISYVSDGSSSGTIPISTLGFAPTDLRLRLASPVVNNKRIFTCQRGNYTEQLAVSDGTSTGTDFISIGNTMNFRDQQKYKLGDAIVFSAKDADGYQLWATDGTPEKTKKLRVLFPPYGARLQNPGLLNGRIYDVHFHEEKVDLFSTDGTSSGTETVSLPITLPVYNDSYYNIEQGADNLWITVKTINQTNDYTDRMTWVYRYTPSTKQFLFATSDTEHIQVIASSERNKIYIGRRGKIYITDDDNVSLHQIGDNAVLLHPIQNSMILGNIDRGGVGKELWSIGTTSGSQRKLFDLPSYWDASSSYTEFEEKLFFKTSFFLVYTDGSPEGTGYVDHLEGDQVTPDSPPVVAGNRLYLTVYGNTRLQLWGIGAKSNCVGEEWTLYPSKP